MKLDSKHDIHDRLLKGKPLFYPYDDAPIESAIVMFDPTKPYEFVICATPSRPGFDIAVPLKDIRMSGDFFKVDIRNKTGEALAELNAAHAASTMLNPKSQNELIRFMNDIHCSFLTDRATELRAIQVPVSTIKDGMAVAQEVLHNPDLLGNPTKPGLIGLNHNLLHFEYPNPQVILFSDFTKQVELIFDKDSKLPKAQVHSISNGGTRQAMGHIEIDTIGTLVSTGAAQDFLKEALAGKTFSSEEADLMRPKLPEANAIKTPNHWTVLLLLKQAHALKTDMCYRVDWLTMQDKRYEVPPVVLQAFDPFDL